MAGEEQPLRGGSCPKPRFPRLGVSKLGEEGRSIYLFRGRAWRSAAGSPGSAPPRLEEESLREGLAV